MSKLIPLSRGLFATVDDDDFDWLNQWKWSALRVKRGNGAERFYAVRVETVAGKQKMFLMHREVARAAAGKNVDHEDRNTLNNRRGNLRECTQGQNSLNQTGHRDRKGSRFKGVYLHKQNRNWCATFRGRHLGSFGDEKDAAAAYNIAALAYDPEFALLNTIDGGCHL